MFSGIVEAIGLITQISSIDGCQNFTIQVKDFKDIKLGESIAVNGVCLSVITANHQEFTVAAVPETLRLTNLSQLKINNAVNLERSLQVSSRIGGHFVQGHVDGIGSILEIMPDNGKAWLVRISLPSQLAKYVVAKGYITLDGMSITVIHVTDSWFTATLIPLTQELTITKNYRIGSDVNIEVDILGKYIERILGASQYAKHS